VIDLQYKRHGRDFLSLISRKVRGALPSHGLAVMREQRAHLFTGFFMDIRVGSSDERWLLFHHRATLGRIIFSICVGENSQRTKQRRRHRVQRGT
jgi:hypothetical protein